MTRLAAILAEKKLTYTAVATRAQLQPRTVRQIATGETPIDNVAVGTVRRIASVLAVSVAELIEPGVPRPGDSTLMRGARLSAAVRELMWGGSAHAYASPVESLVVGRQIRLVDDQLERRIGTEVGTPAKGIAHADIRERDLVSRLEIVGAPGPVAQ